MTDPELERFVKDTILFVRLVPLADGITHLRTALRLIGDHPAAERLREIYSRMYDCDQQLQLMEIGQLKLNLG